MARGFNGSSDAASIAINLSSFNKITVSFWLWWNAFGTNDLLAMEYSVNYNNNTGTFLVDPNSSLSTTLFDIGWQSNAPSGPSEIVRSFTRPSAQAWHHYTFQIDGTQTTVAAIPQVTVDGAVQSLTNTKTGPGLAVNLGNFTLYLMSRAATSLFGNGRMAELAIWGGVLLTALEISALANGVLPYKIRPGSLVSWPPLYGLNSPEPDLSGNAHNATLTGTSFAFGPPTRPFTPRVSQMFVPALVPPSFMIGGFGGGPSIVRKSVIIA